MAAIKTSKSKSQETESTSAGYVFQPFGAKSVALVYKYNLQGEESYKKLITSFERITSLPDSDPRKENLVDLWEAEFNRIFKEYWETRSGKSNTKKSGIEGWKDRLDVKDVSQTPDQKRQDLLGRLTPGYSTSGRNTKEEILKRAGYKEITSASPLNFVAQGRTGQNLKDIESLLDVAEENGLSQPESLLNSSEREVALEQPKPFSVNGDKYDENGYLIEDSREKPKMDPELASFVNAAPTVETIEDDTETLIADESMSREQFNIANKINVTSDLETFVGGSNPIQQPDDAFIPFDLETGVFDELEAKEIHTQREVSGKKPAEIASKMVYTKSDEIIDPSKRNIVSKEGFEIYREENNFNQVSRYESGDKSKPYHEIKPIGDYQVKYDHEKRPSYSDMIDANSRESEQIDELQEKIEFLRDLRNERRHRINMMKIERANSFLISRSRRLSDIRDRKRLKKRDDLNLRAIEKADKLRRAQERQKIIDLMKERQLKRSEEKRVATMLKLERERRLERDVKYRAEVSSLDAQIRHEQEMIKRTELKMKAYFAKNHDDIEFDKSLTNARKVSKYVVSNERAEKMIRLESKKRNDRIEKISKKFNKNIK